MQPDRGASAILDVEKLRVSFRSNATEFVACEDVSYRVWPGEAFAIVGESGCGKSVSSLALMGLQPRSARVSADHCRFDGNEMLGLKRAELAKLRGAKLAMIFQDPMTSLNPVYTIGNQLAEIYTCHALGNRARANERAAFLLDRVGIKNPAMRMKQYPHELSGGLRQRIMIAMAMMCGPKLIIADEPTTALDVTVQALILALLRSLQREFGMALVLITHDLGVVAGVADRVAVMYAGRIVETGTVRQIFQAPSHPYTQGLIDCIPKVDGESRGTRLRTIPGAVPSLLSRPRGCAFHNRCPRVRPGCSTSAIPTQKQGAGHSFQCIHESGWLLNQWRTPAGELS